MQLRNLCEDHMPAAVAPNIQCELKGPHFFHTSKRRKPPNKPLTLFGSFLTHKFISYLPFALTNQDGCTAGMHMYYEVSWCNDFENNPHLSINLQRRLFLLFPHPTRTFVRFVTLSSYPSFR